MGRLLDETGYVRRADMIKTERLILRMPNEVTAKEVCNYYIENRKFLEEFEPVRDEEYYTEEYQDRVLTIQTKDFEEKRSCRFYISESDSPERVIGFIALNNIVMGAFCSCFLGYGLDLEHRNNGYMTEATNRIVKYAFSDLGLHRIEGNVIPRNKASIAVALKCGFKYEGLSKKYLKINGVWEDHAHYVKLNESMEE